MDGSWLESDWPDCGLKPIVGQQETWIEH